METEQTFQFNVQLTDVHSTMPFRLDDPDKMRRFLWEGFQHLVGETEEPPESFVVEEEPTDR